MITSRMRTGLAVLALVALAGFGGAPRPQEPAAFPPPQATTVHPEAREAIDALWSPYCPGLMLEVCPSSGGVMLRDSIERMAREGLSADSIVELVVAEYGERYRARPGVTGFGGLAWFVPPAMLLLGLGGIGVILARRRRASSAPVAGVEPTAAERTKLADAMAELDADEAPDF